MVLITVLLLLFFSDEWRKDRCLSVARITELVSVYGGWKSKDDLLTQFLLCWFFSIFLSSLNHLEVDAIKKISKWRHHGDSFSSHLCSLWGKTSQSDPLPRIYDDRYLSSLPIISLQKPVGRCTSWMQRRDHISPGSSNNRPCLRNNFSSQNVKIWQSFALLGTKIVRIKKCFVRRPNQKVIPYIPVISFLHLPVLYNSSLYTCILAAFGLRWAVFVKSIYCASLIAIRSVIRWFERIQI